MQTVVTLKVRIYPNDEVKEAILKTLRVYREACNYVSAFVYYTETMRLKDLQKELYYELRSKFSLRSQMSISVLRSVRARYSCLEANGHPWTCISFKKPEIDLVWNRDYSLLGDVLSINTLEGRFKIRFSGLEKTFNGKFGTAKLIFRHNKFFVLIPVTCEVPDIDLNDISNVVGVDRGVRFIATTYDSSGKTVFYSGKSVNSKRNHFSKIIKQLKGKKTSSARRRLKSICRREHCWMQDVNHCITKALSQSQPRGTLFVLENLKRLRGCMSNRFPAQNLSWWAYLDFERKLIYKASFRGQKVIKVNPAFTSQTCPLCGRISKRNRIHSKHLFRCISCMYRTNDDRVAAINLYEKGIEYLIQSENRRSFFGGA